MMRGAVTTVVLGMCVLASCSEIKDRTLFDGNYYPARSKYIEGNRAHFVSTVSRIGQGMNGARQAALQEAHRYCIENFGTSAIIWEATPDREVTQADLESGRFSVQGKCEEW